jgi:hypothetical protein
MYCHEAISMRLLAPRLTRIKLSSETNHTVILNAVKDLLFWADQPLAKADPSLCSA